MLFCLFSFPLFFLCRFVAVDFTVLLGKKRKKEKGGEIKEEKEALRLSFRLLDLSFSSVCFLNLFLLIVSSLFFLVFYVVSSVIFVVSSVIFVVSFVIFVVSFVLYLSSFPHLFSVCFPSCVSLLMAAGSHFIGPHYSAFSRLVMTKVIKSYFFRFPLSVIDHLIC